MQPDAILNERYRVIYTVDERPNGLLLRARDDQSNTLVLLGVLPLAGGTSEDIAALARQIATIQHEQLLPLLDYFASEQNYILVCADPGGQDLDRALRSRGGPLPEQETLNQGARLLQLFDTLHTQRPPMYIGDLWPSDLLITDVDWRITPFALARMVSVGPTAYRAPELSNLAAEPSGATDTYTIAAVLYHALTGYAPTTAEQQQAGMPLAAPRSLNPALSALAEQALLRGLQTKPANRYQNAREQRLALETIHLMAGRSLGLGPDILKTSETVAPSEPAPAQVELFLPDVPPSVQTATPGQYRIEPDENPAPRRRGFSTGCLVGLAIGLAVLVIGIAIALVFALTTTGVLNTWLGSAPVAATIAPITLGPNAITAANVGALVRTSEITGELLGPISYAPNGRQIAIGINNDVTLNNPELQEQRRLVGHTGSVIVVAYSPDSRLLASAAKDDNDARIWDAQSGALLHTLKGHTQWLRSVVFSPDGTQLATGGTDNTIKLWNVSDGTLVRTLEGHTDFVGNLVFAPDNKSLASSSCDGTVRIWELADGKTRAGFSYTNQVNATNNKPYFTTGLVFSPDGKRLAVGSFDGSIAIISPVDGKLERRLLGHKDYVVLRGLAFAPNGETLYSGAADGTVREWNVASGSETGTFTGHNFTVIGIAISPDGKQLASISSEEGNLTIWDTATREKLNVLRSGQGLVTGLTYSPDGQALGISGYTGALTLHLADGRQSEASTPGSSMTAVMLENGAIGMLSDADEVRLLRAGSDGIDAKLTGLEGKPRVLAANRAGTLLAVGNDQGVVVLWDANGQQRGAITSESPVVSALAISDDGRYLAVGGPPSALQIEVWEIGAARKLQSLPGPRDGIIGLAFQPGSSRLAAIDLAGELFVWDAPGGELSQILTASADMGRFTTLAFSSNGDLLLCGTLSGELVAWNAADVTEVARHKIAPLAPVMALAVSPDGQQIAASVRNDNASVFMLEVGK